MTFKDDNPLCPPTKKSVSNPSNEDMVAADGGALSLYLIETHDERADSVFGASFYTELDLAARRVRPVAVWNTSVIHGPGVFLSAVHNTVLRWLKDEGQPTRAQTITTTNHPLPLTDVQRSVNQSTSAFTMTLFLVLAFAFIPASQVRPLAAGPPVAGLLAAGSAHRHPTRCPARLCSSSRSVRPT